MTKITASEVNKLRKQTGAGMMDCKNALVDSKGDFEKAIDILRKKGQKIAAKRADRSASEGVVISTVNSSKNIGIIVSLNCETDFVAKNEDFINLANSILELAIKNETTTIEELNSLEFTNGKSIEDNIIEQTGIIGEKLELSLKSIKAEFVSCYIHAGSRLASMVGFDKKIDENIAKDIAMQIAAMNPIAVDKDSVSEDTINKEIEIGKDLAKQEGKPENMLDKIALGRLNKFFKENTLLSQAFIKDSKMSVSKYIASNSENAKVLSFERVGLS